MKVPESSLFLSSLTPLRPEEMFFAKEEVDCNLIPTKEDLLQPVPLSFQPGLGQKLQPSGTGIDFLMFDETTLTAEGDTEVYPLIVKAEAWTSDHCKSEVNPSANSQITTAVFKKREKAEYQVRVIKQILWVNSEVGASGNLWNWEYGFW